MSGRLPERTILLRGARVEGQPQGAGGPPRLAADPEWKRDVPEIETAAAPSTAFGGPLPLRLAPVPAAWAGTLASLRLLRGGGYALAGFGLALVLTFAAPALAQKAKSGAVLPGGNSGKPINIEAVKLDYFDKEQKLIYTGNVVATQGDSKMRASVLTIFLTPKGAGPTAGASTSQVQRMLATGPVTMTQRDQVGTGDNAVYERATNSVVMTGNVTLSQGPNVTKGDKLTYDLKSGQAVVTGRVKSMFIPGSGTPSSDDHSADEAGAKPRRRAASGR